MAKKDNASPSSSSFSFRRLLLGGLLLACAGGGWWAWENNSTVADWKDHLFQYVDNQDIVTLESRYSPEQIMEAHRQELLTNDKKTFQEPIQKYYPFLLLDVKYTEDQKTREGVVLWSLTDGEIVLNTDTWETTHGFKDCVECQASRNDFKVIQALARRQGSLSLDELQRELKVEREVLEPWIESAKQKHLIVQKGQLLQLHFENPRFLVLPQTRLKQQLVSKPIINSQKVGKTYSRSQIINMAQAAFGSDFKIRSEKEIFLPVYRIEVLNPDGSLSATEWNALTGQRILPSYLSQALR
ncbi:hypothetical protein [Candidatus Protochlamydia phocaeensis]|uniref:hypothetical protein n=1 Tax=Candidatus Protochlamydia phocaeensis TaxID=1414722 RepID=UPI0008386CFA|nr:hypothetical protein [Candidatus Protochlamydia phocaeensis]